MIYRVTSLLLLLLSFEAGADTWFVRNLGDCANNGDGTATNCAASGGAAGAFRGPGNINAASVNPGDTVVLLGPITQSASWLTNDAGSAGLSITYTGDGSAWGWPERATITNTGGAYNVSTVSGAYLTFTKIDAIGGNTGDCWGIGTSGASTENSIRLVDVTASDCPTEGVDIKGTTAAGIELENVTVRRAGGTGIFCFVRGTRGNNITIEDSGTEGDANNHDGLAPNDGCDGSTWTNITVRRQKSGLGGGIDVQDSTGTLPITVSGILIENQALASPLRGPCLTSTGTAPVTFSGGVLIGCNDSMLPKGTSGAAQNYFNITAYRPFVRVVKIATSLTGAATNVNLKNLVGVDSLQGRAVHNDVGGSTFTSVNNRFWNSDGSAVLYKSAGEAPCATECTLAEFQGLGYESGTVEVDPQFIGVTNPTTTDGFRLKPSSPLIGTGVVGTKYDYDNKRCGNPSNIGAFCSVYQDTRSSYSIRTDY